MGRYDALTQLDKKPLLETPPPVVSPAADPPMAENEAVSLSANPPAGKSPAALHANLQTRKPANMQAGKQVNLQTGKQIMIEKYSSYLTHEYKRELKRIAFESDRSEYEVLMEAVEQYLTSRKRLK